MVEEQSGIIFRSLRGVRWRVDLGILPHPSSIDQLRRLTADSRRRYAGLRRRLLVDPHFSKESPSASPNPVIDNPLSQNPDSTWGRFFRNAELEKTVDQDLSRLYPEHGSYFQTPACQGMLRRILLLWCLRHPDCGYRQGMHELLAPLLYVLHVDVEHLSELRKQYEDHFTDKFDDLSVQENDLYFDFKKFVDSMEDEIDSCDKTIKLKSLDELDPEIQAIVFLSDAYGAEGELGIVLSEKFIEHDAYSMFDALMSGAHGSVAMADFFSPSPAGVSQSGLPPVIEASAALYHLLSVVDSSLYSHIVEIGVEPQYFALRWLRVLFGREFLLEDLLLVWDDIFAADNKKLEKCPEDDAGSTFTIFCSPRGAFIAAMAVSMILYSRSSLLATEHATSCLQRLLNFPENIDLQKLIAKAKSLQALALASNFSFLYLCDDVTHNRGKSTRGHGHSLSSDSISPKTPLNVVPDSYWEEKWRVLHKAEEVKDNTLGNQNPSGKKRWTEKLRLNLSRTESDPSPDKVRRGKSKTSLRRSLLEDLSHSLGVDEDIDKASFHEVLGQKDDNVEPDVEGQEDVNRDSNCTAEEISHAGNPGSEENSSVFSDPSSSPSGANYQENDSEKSSVASNLSADENDHDPIQKESPLPVSHLANEAPLNSGSNNELKTKLLTSPRERKLLSGKLQWFWKFGWNVPGEEASGKCTDALKPANPVMDGNNQRDPIGSSGDGFCNPYVSAKGDSGDQNVMATLKNLGQSMLEHIQVIESVFQQDRGAVGTLENNFTKNGIVGKGQVTAVTALKELRKISNLLSEM